MRLLDDRKIQSQFSLGFKHQPNIKLQGILASHILKEYTGANASGVKQQN